MTSNRWDAWEPQEPSEDFARRTVAIALRERQARGRAGRARWSVTLVLAAMLAGLVGGAAWGFSAWSDHRAAPLAPIPSPAAPDPVRPVELLGRILPPGDAGSPVPAPAATSRPRKLHAAPEKSAPDAGRKVIVPACDCVPDQVMCTCF
jgi:hypothetical protein